MWRGRNFHDPAYVDMVSLLASIELTRAGWASDLLIAAKVSDKYS
jgi:hypothetical protein